MFLNPGTTQVVRGRKERARGRGLLLRRDGDAPARRRAGRRRDPQRLETVLLTTYWAVSGYGLRAARAVAALALILTLATVGFITIGFSRAQQTVYTPGGSFQWARNYPRSPSCRITTASAD